jgi:hypothetical protein
VGTRGGQTDDRTKENTVTSETPPITSLCAYGEDQAPGAGCIKPAGHDGPHAVVPGEPDDGYCPAEYPDLDGLGFVGHLCDRFAGHPLPHTVVVQLGSRKVTLNWPNSAP